MKHLKFSSIVLTFFIIITSHSVTSVFGQKTKDVYVDNKGVMRWGKSGKEVYGFGVNYTVPFAHAYRTAKKLNINIEKAIEDDIYHFSRLGFDAFRVHVWDTEISDSLGNIIENEHLRLFDFMLTKMKARGMKIILTPIAFWGNGYPEKDEKTPGFATKYGKDACLVNADAILAQEKYLFQFLNHINPYTKTAYKDDADIIAFEVSNEPHHKGTKDEVKAYINKMAASMRKTGCKKPIFYNISHSIHRSDAYFDSNIDGGTFQWYPTSLLAGHELRGNFLPNVDRYVIPFANDPKFRKMAKMVYEFDAADIGRSYIYPAMARSFREAGIQWATHFAYDPTYMAYANTEYSTHYMNLVYAPQKALSLKIASEVFHRVPLYKKYGSYPANTSFEDFKVSYQDDLAEMATDTKFIYTNNTATIPPRVELLEEVSGFGNSSVVKYEGKGAYFLDKIEKGVWRLEVLPDAIWVDNIFGKNNLQKHVAVINSRQWPMEVNIVDIGEYFLIENLNCDHERVSAEKHSFDIKPGVYLLKRKGVASQVNGTTKWKNIQLNEYASPSVNLKKDYVLHKPYQQVISNDAFEIQATIVTSDIPESVLVYAFNGDAKEEIVMKRSAGYDYLAVIPQNLVNLGFINYNIIVKDKTGSKTYPSGNESTPHDWDFDHVDSYTIPVVDDSSPLYLFNAKTDVAEVSKEWRKGSKLIPGKEPATAEMIVEIPQLFIKDPESQNAPEIKDYSLRYNFQPKIKGRTKDLSGFHKLVVRAKSMDNALPMQVSLVDNNGNAFGGIINLGKETEDHIIDITELRQVKLVSLPRPYPTFLPYYFENASTSMFDINSIETIQISIGPGIENADGDFSFAVQSIRLEQ